MRFILISDLRIHLQLLDSLWHHCHHIVKLLWIWKLWLYNGIYYLLLFIQIGWRVELWRKVILPSTKIKTHNNWHKCHLKFMNSNYHTTIPSHETTTAFPKLYFFIMQILHFIFFNFLISVFLYFLSNLSFLKCELPSIIFRKSKYIRGLHFLRSKQLEEAQNRPVTGCSFSGSY